MQRVDSLEKTLMLGGIRDTRKRGRQRMRWLDGITDSMDVKFEWWWTGRPGVLQFMGSQRVGHNWVTELNWICGHSLRHQYVLSHFYFLASANTDLGLFFTHLLLCFNSMQKRDAKVSSALRSQYLGDSVILSPWWHHICTLPIMFFLSLLSSFLSPALHQLWTAERMQLWPIMYSSKSTSYAKKSDSLALFSLP